MRMRTGQGALTVVAAALAALAMLTALGIAERAALACSCLGRRAADYVAEADDVLIVRAAAPRAVGKQQVQALEILHTLKGSRQAGTRVELKRPAGQGGGCDATYARGEVALLFLRGGKANICDGNYSISVMLPKMDEVLSAVSGSVVPDAQVVAEAFLVGTLAKTAPAQGAIKVAQNRVRGRTVTVGSREVRFVARGPKTAYVKAARGLGTLHFASVELPDRRTVHVLYRDDTNGPALLAEAIRKPGERR